MFVRWIERPSKSEGLHFTALSALLVESKRINGVPRQRHIGYLGGITDEQIGDLQSRCYFWDQVVAAFDKLDAKVKPEDRLRFEAAIAARVPRPSADEYDEYRATAHERVLPPIGDAMREAMLNILRAHCSFCGKNDCADLVKGETGAMICGECITTAAKAFAERKANNSD
jgi:hypothetical protein